MTIESTTFRTAWLTANGVTDEWPYAFTIYAADTVVVLVKTSAGVITEHTTNLTWLRTNDTSGHVKYPVTGTKVPSGSEVRIERRVPYLQKTAIGNQGAFYPVVHERAFDSGVMQNQQLADLGTRALKADVDTGVYQAGGARITGVGTPTTPTDAIDWQTASTLALNNTLFTPSGAGAVATTVDAKLKDAPISVKDFGAKGDYVSPSSLGTDDTVAFQLWATHLRTFGGKAVIPEGKYRLTDEINLYRPNSPRIDVEIEGAGEFSTIIVSDFFGADKSVFKSKDPLGLTRSSPLSIHGVGYASVTRSGGVVPCYLDIEGWGESRVGRLRFGASNNTLWRAQSLQNIRGGDITSFFGGKHFLYKATNGVTFSTTSSGTVITASSGIFDANDVGRIITILSASGANNIKYVIAGYTSPTQVTVTGTTLAATDQVGHFESARVAIDIGTDATLVTANAPCFSANDVGYTVYIRNARAGAWGAGLLRAKITEYIGPTQVRIDTAATRTITAEYIAVPAVDLWKGIQADSNDVILNNLQIESFSGVGLVIDRSIFMHIMGKVHGVSSTWSDTAASTNHIWGDDWSGTFTGTLDAPCNGDCRVHLSDMNDLLTFPWLGSRRTRQETILIAEEFTDPGGYVEIKSLNTYSAASDPKDLFIDNNTVKRVQFTGLINMLGDSQPARKYVGQNVYVSEDRMTFGSVLDPTRGNLNIGSAAGARIQLERNGSRVYTIGNNTGTGFTIRDESAGLDRLLLASSGNFVPGANNSQNWGSLTARFATGFFETMSLGPVGVIVVSGTGSPEGVVTAPPGSVYLRRNPTSFTDAQYRKVTGTGNTGWADA